MYGICKPFIQIYTETTVIPTFFIFYIAGIFRFQGKKQRYSGRECPRLPNLTGILNTDAPQPVEQGRINVTVMV